MGWMGARMKIPGSSAHAGLAQVAMRLAEHGRKPLELNDASSTNISSSPDSTIRIPSKSWFSIRLL